MKANVPFVPQQYLDLSGLPDAGGYIWIYLKGTSTPATSAIWFDIDGTTPGTNPVVLDASGKPDETGAFYLDPGAYTLKLYSADDVQLGAPVDIIISGSTFGGGSETVNQGGAIICKTYNDVRGLTQAWDAVYVAGRASEGDGGEGWFQLVPTETGVDDDGICLVAGDRRYVRVFDSEIMAEWYGVAYGGSIDQTANLTKARTASLRWNFPFSVTGDIYLTQNNTVENGEAVNVHLGGRFISSTGAGVTITFKSGSRIVAQGETFGIGLSPKFEANVVDVVPLSWMGGAVGDDKLDKWASCSTAEQVILLDASINAVVIPTFPSNLHLDVVPGSGKITATAAVNLSVDVVYQGAAQWLEWGSASNIGSVYVGKRPCRPEWFGAVGNNTADDGIPLRAAAKSGDILAGYNKSYRTTIQVSTAPFTVRGDTTSTMTARTLDDVTDPTNPRIFMDPASAIDVVALSSSGTVAFIGASLSMSSNATLDTNSGVFVMSVGTLFASSGKVKSTSIYVHDSVVSSLDVFTASVSNQYLDNVRDENEPTRRKYRKNSSFQDVYMENIKKTTSSTKILSVDANGKIEGVEAIGKTGDTNVVGTLRIDGDTVTVFNYTLIEFTSGNVYRDGVDLGAGTYYDVSESDRPVIAVINNNSSIVCQIRPANRPSLSLKMEVVNIGPYRVDVGDVSGSSFCWLSAYPVKLPDTTLTNGKMATIGWKINGKWSFS